MLRPRCAAHDDARDRGGGLRLESGWRGEGLALALALERSVVIRWVGH
jgi:hypothetical protein